VEFGVQGLGFRVWGQMFMICQVMDEWYRI
jgi:hypothetical protein